MADECGTFVQLSLRYTNDRPSETNAYCFDLQSLSAAIRARRQASSSHAPCENLGDILRSIQLNLWTHSHATLLSALHRATAPKHHDPPSPPLITLPHVQAMFVYTTDHKNLAFIPLILHACRWLSRGGRGPSSHVFVDAKSALKSFERA